MELLFESRENLAGFDRHLNFVQRRPQMHGEPVLRPDTFVDGAGVYDDGSVLPDGGKLRMWYGAVSRDRDYQNDPAVRLDSRWGNGISNLTGPRESFVKPAKKQQ
jgi:hypothetical protein